MYVFLLLPDNKIRLTYCEDEKHIQELAERYTEWNYFFAELSPVEM